MLSPETPFPAVGSFAVLRGVPKPDGGRRVRIHQHRADGRVLVTAPEGAERITGHAATRRTVRAPAITRTVDLSNLRPCATPKADTGTGGAA